MPSNLGSIFLTQLLLFPIKEEALTAFLRLGRSQFSKALRAQGDTVSSTKNDSKELHNTEVTESIFGSLPFREISPVGEFQELIVSTEYLLIQMRIANIQRSQEAFFLN